MIIHGGFEKELKREVKGRSRYHRRPISQKEKKKDTIIKITEPDPQTDRPADRQTRRQIDPQTDRPTDRQMDRLGYDHRHPQIAIDSSRL